MSITIKEETYLLDDIEHINNTLIQWIKKNNGFIHENLSVHSEVNNNDISRSILYKNKTPLLVNDTITKIPYNLVISIDTFNQIPNIEHWITLINEHSKLLNKAYCDHFKIIVALLYENSKKENSFYSPYINTLPKINSFKNHPIILYFQDKHMFNILNKISPYFIQQVDAICHELFFIMELFFLCNKNFPIFDSTLYSNESLQQLVQWAFIIKKTRSWEDGLVPFNDFFNHNDNSTIRLKKISADENIKNENFYVFKADIQFNNIKENDEIYNNYGYYNSMILLIFYNFLQTKQITHLNVPFDFSKTSPLNKLRISELKKSQLSSNKILLSNKGPTKDLFKILRILSLTKEELLIHTNKKEELYENIISNKNEIKSIRLLLKLILDLKNSSYTLENMNLIHDILHSFKDKELSPHELILKNVCLIAQDEYKIIEDNLHWISDVLLKLIEQSEIKVLS